MMDKLNRPTFEAIQKKGAHFARADERVGTGSEFFQGDDCILRPEFYSSLV
jgi:hypothetical protein